MKTLTVAGRKAWRSWLRKHHAREKGVWLVNYLKATGKRTITYREALEEALCFGWIDSIQKRLDEERFAQRFTPRSAGSRWSRVNVALARRLVEDGLMTTAGLAAARPALEAKHPPEAPRPRGRPRLPSDFRAALAARPGALERFGAWAPGYQRRYVGWITAAKRPETRARRIREAVALVARGVKALMK